MSPSQAQAFLRSATPELFEPREAKGVVKAEQATDQSRQSQPGARGLKAHQLEAEYAEILKVLADCAGDRVLASQRLGISRTTLWRKLKASA